jgi:hypothetical protein
MRTIFAPLRLYYHVVRADLLERTRRYSFLVTLLFIIFMGYLVYTGQIRFTPAGIRAEQNAAWLGIQMALVATTFMSLIGFYLVKNCIDRDERTRVGQIIATTPMSSLQYLLGKWLSNLIVLALILGILALASVLMQVRNAGLRAFDAGALLGPMLLIGLPAMSLTAALAVFFESTPLLRGGVGNVAYFFLWTFGLISSIEVLAVVAPGYDPIGYGLAVSSILPVIQTVIPGYDQGFSLGIITQGAAPLRFTWTGIAWTADLLLARGVVFLAPLALIVLGALFFGRFDPARNFQLRRIWKLRRSPAANGAADELEGSALGRSTIQVAKAVRSRPAALHRAAQDFTAAPDRFAEYTPAFLRLLAQNLRLLVKSNPTWLLLGLAGLWLGSLVADAASAPYWLMAISVAPVLVWSQLGSRETAYRTEGLVFSAPHPLTRLLAAEWLTGVLLTAFLFSGVGINLAIHGEAQRLAALGLGALLIPTAALALGVWSGSRKLFEALYLVVWYTGIANQMGALDYLGMTPGAFVRQSPLLALGLVAALLAAAWLGRSRQALAR